MTQKTTPQKSTVQDTQSSVVVKESEKITSSTKKVADVYIVLDDGGHNLSHLKPFLDLRNLYTIMPPLWQFTEKEAKPLRN